MRIILELVINAIGTACSIALLTGVPIALYAIAAAIGPDAGGPMNLVLVPLIAFAFATFATLCLILPAALLSDWLTRRRGWPKWPVLPAFILLAMSASWIWAATEFTSTETRIVVGTAVGLLVGAGFALQWGIPLVARKVLARVLPAPEIAPVANRGVFC